MKCSLIYTVGLNIEVLLLTISIFHNRYQLSYEKIFGPNLVKVLIYILLWKQKYILGAGLDVP